MHDTEAMLCTWPWEAEALDVHIVQLCFYLHCYIVMHHLGASLVSQTVKNLSEMRETWVDAQVEKVPWRREWLPTPVFLPGEFHGQRSLAGYSPWGRRESDRIDLINAFTFHFQNRFPMSQPDYAEKNKTM